MIDNVSIGKRMKETRLEQGLTLKAIEARAGVSATHISEIERGKTSPTIGALSKIAHALGKDITYFVEREALSDVGRLTFEDHQKLPLPWDKGHYVPLTKGIPGSKLSAYLIHLDAGGVESPEQSFEGNDVFVVKRGRVAFTVEGHPYELGEGDAIHMGYGCPHSYRNAGEEPAEMYHFSGHRCKV